MVPWEYKHRVLGLGMTCDTLRALTRLYTTLRCSLFGIQSHDEACGFTYNSSHVGTNTTGSSSTGTTTAEEQLDYGFMVALTLTRTLTLAITLALHPKFQQ